MCFVAFYLFSTWAGERFRCVIDCRAVDQRSRTQRNRANKERSRGIKGKGRNELLNGRLLKVIDER